MTFSRATAFGLLALLAGCGGPPPPPPREPGIPLDKIEEIEGWVQFKGWNAAAAQNVRITTGPKEVTITSGSNAFTLPASAYRVGPKQDFAEIALGARLTTPAPPQKVGAVLYDKNTLPARTAEKCGGKSTLCVPVWHGCGPIACEDSGEIIGVGCGGWTPATAPR